MQAPVLIVQLETTFTYNPRTRSWVQAPGYHNGLAVPTPSFNILTWNIDFSRPRPHKRLRKILSSIERTLSPFSSTPPTIICLQEFPSSCFSELLSGRFIRENYNTTNIDNTTWPISGATYGLVTLIPKFSAPYVCATFRTPFNHISRMGREALYIDILFRTRIPFGLAMYTSIRKIRIANTHLESLAGFGDIARPQQLVSIAEYLYDPFVQGGLVAGDMNPISPSDDYLAQQVGLDDAWLVMHQHLLLGSTATDYDLFEQLGYTWGFQPPSRQFAPSRLDRVLFRGALRVNTIERIGVDLRLRSGEWASDHVGLLATMTVI